MSETTTTNQVKVGSIFCMSWGYDQTNVNFFQVTRMAKSGGVFVREICQQPVEGSEGFMSNKVKPLPGMFLQQSQWCHRPGQSYKENRETFRKLRHGGFNFKGRYFARPITADASYYCSWYA